MSFKDEWVRNDYKADIQVIRDRHGDEVKIDWIERYHTIMRAQTSVVTTL